MSDPKAPQTSESMADIIQAVTRGLPAYMQAQNSQLLPTAQAQLGVAQATSRPTAQLQQDLLDEFGPQLAKTGVDIEGINRLGAANTDLAILQGPGGQLAGEAQKIDRTLNPEFYSTRENIAGKLASLLGSINLDNANPEAERLIGQENARTGNSGNSSNLSTLSNALSFGSELDKRRNSLESALSVATNALQPMQGQFNPVVTALNRPSTNANQSQFTGVQKPGGEAYASGNQLLGSATQVKGQENEINANRRDALDRTNEVLQGIGSIVSI